MFDRRRGRRGSSCWRSPPWPTSLTHHHVAHLKAKPCAKACAHSVARRAAFAHGFGRFPFQVVIKVARDPARGALVERLFDRRGQRDVLDIQLGDRQAVFGQNRVDGLRDEFADIAGVGGHVEDRNA